MYPTANEQHDFMYNKMIPTMQKVLSEIRDEVTTDAGRIGVSDLKIYTKTDNSNSTPQSCTSTYFLISRDTLVVNSPCVVVPSKTFVSELNTRNLILDYQGREGVIRYKYIPTK